MPFSASNSNPRLPSNIPLTDLSSSGFGSRHDHEESTSFLGGAQGQHSGHHVDRPGPDSDDTDSWVSTGDIGEHIDAEDPLRQRLNSTVDESALVGLKHLSRHSQHSSSASKKETKHVRIQEDPEHVRHRSARHSGVVNKEAIEIPELISHKPSRAERLLASIMPGHSKGFTGKPLMYVLAVCTSLSVVPRMLTFGVLPVTSRVYSCH